MNDTTPPGPYGLPDWRQASRRFCRPVLSRLCLAASKTHRSPSSRHAPKRRTGFDLYTSPVDDRLFFSGEMFFPLVRLGGSSWAATSRTALGVLSATQGLLSKQGPLP